MVYKPGAGANIRNAHGLLTTIRARQLDGRMKQITKLGMDEKMQHRKSGHVSTASDSMESSPWRKYLADA